MASMANQDGQARKIAIIVGSTVAVLALFAVGGTFLGRSSQQLSPQEAATKLDYLNGVTAVTAYKSLSGYPVTFVMENDGNELGTWQADIDDTAITWDEPNTLDVTDDVKESATNVTSLDDDRYIVTGHGDLDEQDGSIVVWVEESFTAAERRLSQTISIDDVARALSSYIPAGQDSPLTLSTLRAVSIEEDNIWCVLGTATDSAGEDVIFRAKVTGTSSSAVVIDFEIVR